MVELVVNDKLARFFESPQFEACCERKAKGKKKDGKDKRVGAKGENPLSASGSASVYSPLDVRLLLSPFNPLSPPLIVTTLALP